MFSAISLARASSMPSVQPATCGVISTFDNSWKGRVAGAARPGSAGIAIPHIKRGTPDRTLRQGLVECILIDDLRPRHVDQEGCRFHQSELPAIDRPDRIGGRGHRNQYVVRTPEHLADRVRTAEKGWFVIGRAPNIAANCRDVHVEGASAASDRLTDAPIPKYSERFARQL